MTIPDDEPREPAKAEPVATLSDEWCDEIRNECNRKWLALPVSVDRPPWEHWLIRAGYAAREPEKNK